MGDRSEAEWVRAAIDRHERPLLRFASTLVGSSQARDVVQDVLLELCRADRAHIENHLAAWLFTVCRNKAFSARRERVRFKLVEEDAVLESLDSGPSSSLERKEAHKELLAAIEDLDERQREVIALRFAGGLSYKEIAEVMSLSVGNVGFILHHAVKTLRSKVADESVGAAGEERSAR